jgi:hypothetical protein
MDQTRLGKTFSESKPQGERKMRWPGVRCLEDADNDLQRDESEEMEKKANNRGEWETALKQAKVSGAMVLNLCAARFCQFCHEALTR